MPKVSKESATGGGDYGAVLGRAQEIEGYTVNFVSFRGGLVPDQLYGLSWQVVPTGMDELFSDSDPERASRAMEAMLMKKLDIAELRAAADGVATTG